MKTFIYLPLLLMISQGALGQEFLYQNLRESTSALIGNNDKQMIDKRFEGSGDLDTLVTIITNQKINNCATKVVSEIREKLMYQSSLDVRLAILALRQKDLKKLLAYSSLSHVGLIAAGSYTLTLDGLRGAVLQMIAHGFVIVGLFFAAEIIFRRYETRTISEMGGIRAQSPKFTSMFMILVLASVALPSTFNFVGEFTVLYSLSQVNLMFAILGGTTIILGAYYMLKMFQHVMLGETNTKIFYIATAKKNPLTD